MSNISLVSCVFLAVLRPFLLFLVAGLPRLVALSLKSSQVTLWFVGRFFLSALFCLLSPYPFFFSTASRRVTMRPLFMMGHSRPLTWVTFNRDGDLLFTCGKVPSSHFSPALCTQENRPPFGSASRLLCLPFHSPTTKLASL